MVFEKGKHNSTEYEFKKGNIPWNKGLTRKLDLEYIKNQYINNKRSVHSIAKEFNISHDIISDRLKQMNILIRDKYDKSYLAPWNKDKITGQIPWNKNIPWSEEIKDKVRQTKKQYFLEHPEAKLKMKEQRASQVFPLTDSKIEIKIQNYLNELGIEFYTHKFMHIEHGYQCDIYIPHKKLVIECDGDYWHGNPLRNKELNERQKKQRELDNLRTKELESKGFKVIRLWESNIKPLTIEKFKELI